MFYYFLALLVYGIDQLTKLWIVKSMKFGDSFSVIPNVLYIISHRNKGAAFGILQNQRWFFVLITIAVILAVVYYMKRHARSPLLKIALALVLGGAVGNFTDRLFRGEVVDFIGVYIGSYDFPIFNVADSSLVIGVGLIFIHSILEGRLKEKRHGDI